jgi:hypothetical protein
MFTLIVTRDRFSATKTEVHLALIAREGSFVVKADLPSHSSHQKKSLHSPHDKWKQTRLLFDVLRVVSVGLFFACKLYLVAWRGGTFSSMDTTSTVRETSRKMSSALRLHLSYFYIVLLL